MAPNKRDKLVMSIKPNESWASDLLIQEIGGVVVDVTEIVFIDMVKVEVFFDVNRLVLVVAVNFVSAISVVLLIVEVIFGIKLVVGVFAYSEVKWVVEFIVKAKELLYFIGKDEVFVKFLIIIFFWFSFDYILVISQPN